MPVTCEIRDGVAVVTIDNPPVNALSRAIREDLWQIAGKTEDDPAIRAVVLIGAGKLFIGGADITEFDRPPEAPTLPDLLSRVESATKPWVVAMHGTTLGGGLELALVCRFRVAAQGSKFGLPEVNLGIIPGSGGTQRLPRLICVAAAVPVVAEKKMLDDAAAQETGLVDHVITGDLLTGAIAFARDRLDQPLPPRARDRDLADPGDAFWTAASERIGKSSKGQTAPLQALAAVRFGLDHGFDRGLAEERRVFLDLKAGTESAALRYLFFAERAAPRPAELRDVRPRDVRRVGVVGGGTMGVGIAAALRNAGLPVVLSERDEPGLARALAGLRSVFEATVKRGLITADEALRRLDGVTGVVGLTPLADSDLVIEAVFEDLAVKRQVFAELSGLCRTDAILATNTSYIDPRLIAKGFAGPDRFIGLHFFSPAQVMKLLEIIPLPETAPDVLAAAFELGRRLGKIPVKSGICDGFIGNRILRRYRIEAETMIRDGIAPAQIDAAMRAFGYAMGPFEMQDMAGLDISFLHREAARARGEDVPLTPGDILVRAGRKGQKTGGGWYDYLPGDRTPRPSPEVARLMATYVERELAISADDIRDRLLAAMADEGRLVLEENIASSPEAIDLVEVHGYGFPRGKGGPMFMASRGLLSTDAKPAAEV